MGAFIEGCRGRRAARHSLDPRTLLATDQCRRLEPALTMLQTSARSGRRSMRVRDIMTKSVVSISPEASVAEALDTMLRSKLSGLPVIDSVGRLVGVVSEADFIRRAELG